MDLCFCFIVALLLMQFSDVFGGTPGTHYVYSSIIPTSSQSFISFNFVNNNPSHVDIDLITSPCSHSISGVPQVLYKTGHTINEYSPWSVQSGVDGWYEQTSPNVVCTGTMTFYVDITVPAGETAAFIIGSQYGSGWYMRYTSNVPLQSNDGEDVVLNVGGSGGWAGYYSSSSNYMYFNPRGFSGSVRYTIPQTGAPSSLPSEKPTGVPTANPSSQPSAQPSGNPSGQPSALPSSQPSGQPSNTPTSPPSGQPSSQPSGQPSLEPSGQPSGQPSSQPISPTEQPTSEPTQPTGEPSGQPSSKPTGQPSCRPTQQPTGQPSSQPTQPTGAPSSSSPTGAPTNHPVPSTRRAGLARTAEVRQGVSARERARKREGSFVVSPGRRKNNKEL